MSAAFKLVVGAASVLGLTAAAPSDFTAAAQFATALVSSGAIPASAELVIETGTTPQPLALADYREQRSECELNRLIRVQGRSAIGVEWRCGPLYARVNDVYAITDGRVARVLANAPFLIMAPRQPSDPR